MTDADAREKLWNYRHGGWPSGVEIVDEEINMGAWIAFLDQALDHAIARLEPCDDLGMANHHGWNFCPYCGGRLVEPEEATEERPQRPYELTMADAKPTEVQCSTCKWYVGQAACIIGRAESGMCYLNGMPRPPAITQPNAKHDCDEWEPEEADK